MIPHLDKVINRFQGLKLFNIEKTSYIKTIEGASAYLEAITFLKKQRPVKPLLPCDELCLSCQDHINDIGPKGIEGSQGSDGSMPTQRI
jgi:hypothetical protein